MAFIGEVGLTGEIRPVNQIETRIQEASRLGFKKIVIPKGNTKNLKTKDVKLITPSYLSEIIKELF